MIIVYNLPGLVLAAGGIVAGVILLVLTGSLGAGVLTIATAWIGVGLWWRHSGEEGKRPYPSIYFIPLPFAGGPLVFLALALLALQAFGTRAQADTRGVELKADEETLNNNSAGGDEELSQQILDVFQEAAGDPQNKSGIRIFTRIAPHGVLVLVKIPDLKKHPNGDRERLLKSIATLVRKNESLRDQPIYIGIKGKVAYGAIMTPPEKIEVGSVVISTLLYGVYGPASEAKGKATVRTE